MFRLHQRTIIAGFVLLVAASTLRADVPTTQPIEPAQFMRFDDRGQAGGALQTAVVTYRNPAGQTVRLVAAIHIAEAGYYQQLNRDFASDDAVLYELVAPKDSPLPKPGTESSASDNPISQLQHFMKDALNLSFQLDVIDYTKPNFVHADLDKETFEKLQEERGETFEMLFIRQLMDAFTKPQPADENADSGPTADQFIQMLTRPDGDRQIKLVVAKQLADMQNSGKGMDAIAGTVLLGERNKAALKVLDTTLASGKQRISIFYGAAHMPDLATNLKTMGFTPTSCEWRTAWDLAIRPDEPSAIEKLLTEAVHAFSSSDDQN
jgi:hypothetical protein